MIAVISVVLAVGVGGLAVVQPLAALALVPTTAVFMLLTRADHLDKYFLVALGIALVGYAFFGRGFAYLGAVPVYVGEVILCLAVLAMIVNISRWRFGLIECLMIAFMFLGVMATVPYLTIHGVDALRDAVIWGYAIIALAVSWLLRREHLERMMRGYGALVLPLILWTPIALASMSVLNVEFPTYPWSNAAIVDVKPGDMAIHLAGAAAFILTGLWMRRSGLSSMAEGILWGVWFLGFTLAASWNRGGMVAATIAITALLVLRPDRRMLIPILSMTLIVIAFVFVDPSVELRAGREVSVDQITTNLRSVVDQSESDRLSGTREWRLNWWSKIVDYTVRGEYFWTGKGFGINLRTEDLPHNTGVSELRSPHSSHMTVLARMGVPGAAVWIMLQGAFALTMLSSIYRSYSGNDWKLTSVLVFLFVYWIAMVVNSSFDVYFEGPQGGIWFWAVIGAGLAASRLQQELPHGIVCDSSDDHESELTPGARERLT